MESLIDWKNLQCFDQVMGQLCCSSGAAKSSNVRPPLALGTQGQPTDLHVQYCWRCAEGGEGEHEQYKCTTCFRALHLVCMRLSRPAENDDAWRCHYCQTRDMHMLT